MPANAKDLDLTPDPEDPTSLGANKPAGHGYWAWALEPGAQTTEAHMP